jgi:hypothetical protein
LVSTTSIYRPRQYPGGNLPVADDFDFSVFDAKARAKLRNRFSRQAQDAVIAEVRKHADDLIQNTLEVSERKQADIASATEVRAVASLLIEPVPKAETQKGLVALGGIFFGCAFCYSFSVLVGAATATPAAVVWTFLVGSLGAFMMARDRPWRLRLPGFIRYRIVREEQGPAVASEGQSDSPQQAPVEIPSEERAAEVPAAEVPADNGVAVRRRSGVGRQAEVQAVLPLPQAAASAQSERAVR